jgi:hypothetical protein
METSRKLGNSSPYLHINVVSICGHSICLIMPLGSSYLSSNSSHLCAPPRWSPHWLLVNLCYSLPESLSVTFPILYPSTASHVVVLRTEKEKQEGSSDVVMSKMSSELGQLEVELIWEWKCTTGRR